MHALQEKLSGRRLADNLWELVNVPSPTCHEREAALVFAKMLEKAGATVEIDESLPQSPSVIGRLRGNGPGPVLQLAGHLDHIDIPHTAPQRDPGIISGRGSADMKNGLSGMLEIVHVLHEDGCRFPGEVLITAYGLHEAPNGNSAAIISLIRRGIVGDAAIVCETVHSARGKVVVSGKGQSIWNLRIHRQGGVSHELNRPPDADDLVAGIHLVLKALDGESRRLQGGQSHALLGPETLFIGQVHYGDFYNRCSVDCTIQGTRRWNPGRQFADITGDFAGLLSGLRLPETVSVDCDWMFVGEAYEIDPGERIVANLQAATREILGTEAPIAGISAIVDANRLVPFGGVPTVVCGFDCEHAHADWEFVRLPELELGCRVALETSLNFLEGAVKGSDDDARYSVGR